jgi:hypothetical protein
MKIVSGLFLTELSPKQRYCCHGDLSYLPPLQRGTEGDLLLAARIKSPLAPLCKGG